ncbi:MAG TPA: hypothetical protein VGI63_04930 [Verrucomicrobiae bacterium]|jgi:hypothetical protein
MSITAINIIIVVVCLAFFISLIVLYAAVFRKIIDSLKSSNATNTKIAKMTGPKVRSGDVQQDVRKAFLTISFSERKIKPSSEFPRTQIALMDWPMRDFVATVISCSDGNGSVYAGGKIIAIGGIYHESTRQASINFVKLADRFFEDSVAVTDYPFPSSDKVRFYLVTFDGVRMIEADLKAVSDNTGKDKFANLFRAGNNVVTQLRLTEVRLVPKKKNATQVGGTN